MKIYHKLALFSLDYVLLFISKTRSFKEIKLHVWKNPDFLAIILESRDWMKSLF